jgi:hypothetical protein
MEDIRVKSSRTKSVFISYRRDDTATYAERIYRDLTRHYGVTAVFYDLVSLGPGVDFARRADDAIRHCDALLLLIGRSFFKGSSTSTTRLASHFHDHPQYLFGELRNALDRNIPVVPILVNEATLPDVDDWPTDLHGLARINVITLSDASWQPDIERLVSALDSSIRPHASKHWTSTDISWEQLPSLRLARRFPLQSRDRLKEVAHQLAQWLRGRALMTQVLYRRDHIAVETRDTKRWHSAAGYMMDVLVVLVPGDEGLTVRVHHAAWTDQAPAASPDPKPGQVLLPARLPITGAFMGIGVIAGTPGILVSSPVIVGAAWIMQKKEQAVPYEIVRILERIIGAKGNPVEENGTATEPNKGKRD